MARLSEQLTGCEGWDHGIAVITVTLLTRCEEGIAVIDVYTNFILNQGVRDVIAVGSLMDAIPAINRAFHHARKISKVNTVICC